MLIGLSPRACQQPAADTGIHMWRTRIHIGALNGSKSRSITLPTLDDRILHDPSEDIIAQ